MKFISLSKPIQQCGHKLFNIHLNHVVTSKSYVGIYMSGKTCVLSMSFYPESQFVKYASTQRKSEVVKPAKPRAGDVTVAQKVKQAGKDVTYGGIVLVGLGVTGLMFYAIGRELFSSQSSSGVYSKAFKDCLNSTEVTDTLGEPLKGYGETTRRGRRRHVSHSVYELEGVKHMRMKFYIEGPFKKATVHLEVKQNESGKYVYRYLFVELEDYPSRTIIIEDNR